MAHQWITLDGETGDDATIEGEVKQVEKEGKSAKIVKKGKKVLANVNIVDISNEDETTPLS